MSIFALLPGDMIRMIFDMVDPWYRPMLWWVDRRFKREPFDDFLDSAATKGYPNLVNWYTQFFRIHLHSRRKTELMWALYRSGRDDAIMSLSETPYFVQSMNSSRPQIGTHMSLSTIDKLMHKFWIVPGDFAISAAVEDRLDLVRRFIRHDQVDKVVHTAFISAARQTLSRLAVVLPGSMCFVAKSTEAQVHTLVLRCPNFLCEFLPITYKYLKSYMRQLVLNARVWSRVREIDPRVKFEHEWLHFALEHGSRDTNIEELLTLTPVCPECSVCRILPVNLRDSDVIRLFELDIIEVGYDLDLTRQLSLWTYPVIRYLTRTGRLYIQADHYIQVLSECLERMFTCEECEHTDDETACEDLRVYLDERSKIAPREDTLVELVSASEEYNDLVENILEDDWEEEDEMGPNVNDLIFNLIQAHLHDG